MGLRHARAWAIAVGCVATSIGLAGTATAAPTPAGGGRAQVPAEFTASFTVTKVLDFEPASWPITVQLVDIPALAFEGGASSATQRTDEETGDTTFTVTTPDGQAPEGDVTLLITEPVRADGALGSIECVHSSTDYRLSLNVFSGKLWFDDGKDVGGYVSLASNLLDGLECTLFNDSAMPLSLTKEVDGTSEAEFPLAAIPQTDGLIVGHGIDIDEDGIFPTSDGGITEVGVAFGGTLPRSESSATLLIGEALGDGYMFAGVDCEEQIQEEQVPALAPGLTSDAPLYLVDGVVGIYVDVNQWEIWNCTITNAIPGLTATKTASVSNPTPGTSFTYTVTATNSGRTPLLDATLSDPMPSGITATAATASTGTCTVAAGQVDCDLGDLAIGANSTVTINATVGSAATDGQAFANTATVTGQVPEWDPALAVDTPQIQETLVAPTTHAVTATASVTISAVVPTTTTQAPTTTAAPTTAAPTTTVAVAQAAPTTTVVIPIVSPAVLPRTGGGVQLLPVALWTLATGTVLVLVRRIRRHRTA